jgi:hypothetical protein
MPTQTQWLSPSPLWNRFAPSTDKTAFRTPALLRFSTDTFMQDFQALLAQNPQAIDSLIAQPESWRFPAAGLPPLTGSGISSSSVSTGSTSTASTGAAAANSPESEADVPPTNLKFYQPAHARFYLVTASLACRLPGLPDHTVKRNQGETTTFVIRKLQLKSSITTPPSGPPDLQNYDEYAWLPNAAPPGWLLVDPTTLAPGEEQLPLFNMQFGSNGKQRRLYAGMIPVGKRQTYVSARALQSQSGAPPAPATVDDPRKLEFQRQVLDPWGDLVSWASKLDQSAWINTSAALLPSDEFAAAQGSAYILIDFGKFLEANLPQVWAAVGDAAQVTALTGAQLDLYDALGATMADAKDTNQTTLAQALFMASEAASAFESETLALNQHLDLPPGYVGPLLTDPQLNGLIGRPQDSSFLAQRPIETLIENALNQQGASPQSPVPPPAKDPQNPRGDDWFIIRCLYQRPLCAVKTIPAPIVFSAPSQPFQLASFFDPDAPARRIQVALPVDTTPAALRKYDKGVAFMISDQLNQQMQRVKGLKQLMDGTIDDPSGFGLGMICSFSIPIITICALIVLFIFVILLNIVFFWLPFLKICFPLPTFKAKG